jgi:protein-disulfide isomerase
VSDRWERIGTVAVIVASAVVVATSVRRELGARNTIAPAPAIPAPAFVPDWQSLSKDGIRIGRADAPTQIMEFADFECPFCAAMERHLLDLRHRMGPDLAVVFVQFPLSYHRFALPAARVAECANDQGRFEAMHDLLFLKQDSLGLKAWASFAEEAGVPDVSRFLSCASDTTTPPRVTAGMQLGARLGVRGTPTLIINGWQYWGLQPDSLEVEVRRRATSG